MNPIMGHHSKMFLIIYREIVTSGVSIERVSSGWGWKRHPCLNWRDIGSSWLCANQFANGLSKGQRMNTAARARCSQDQKGFIPAQKKKKVSDCQ